MSQISLVFDWAILRFPIIIDIWDFFRRLVHRRFEADYGQISAYLIHLTQESWSKRLGRKIPKKKLSR